MKTATTTKTSRPAQAAKVAPATATDLLTSADVPLLERRQELKDALTRLDKMLKPRISATIDKLGTGLVQVGDRHIELSRSVRTTYSWRAVAYVLAPEEVVDKAKEGFALDSNIDKCKVLK